MNTTQLHPIKIAAKRSGLSPHVIRVWEKRYSAVTPVRTETNRRLYSNADIERLLVLRRATLAGRSIGQIASLSTDSISSLLIADEASLPAAIESHSAVSSSVSAQPILENALAAVKQLDGALLESILGRAAVEISQPVLIEQVIIPLMYEVGDRWRRGDLRILHEHLVSSVVSIFLGNMKRRISAEPSAPAIIVSTPAGQRHEFGALAAAVTAASDGWSVTYLGPNLPAAEIAEAARQNNARAVALSIVYPGDDHLLQEELTILREALPSSVALILGGRSAVNYSLPGEDEGVFLIHDLQALRRCLDRVRNA